MRLRMQAITQPSSSPWHAQPAAALDDRRVAAFRRSANAAAASGFSTALMRFAPPRRRRSKLCAARALSGTAPAEGSSNLANFIRIATRVWIGVILHYSSVISYADAVRRRASARSARNALYRRPCAARSQAQVPPLWDGKAAERIVDMLERFPLEEPAVAPSR